MKRLYSLFPLLIAGLLAAASFWLAYVVQNERPSGLGNRRHDADAVVEKVKIEHFDTRGKLQFNLVADKLVHFPDNDVAELTNPLITFNDPVRPSTWTSDRASASNDTHTVVLTGHVRGQRPGDADEAAQSISTEELTLLTDDEIARTNKPITFIQGTSRIDGVGAEWNHINGVLTVRQARADLAPGSNQ